jgi:(E)-4-hydroxy-3-methylbut-2-enyl-diphosphate synthase
MIPNVRRVSKQIQIGDVKIGGDAPVVVQSMCSTDTSNVEATVRQVHELVELGCEVVRIAVPDKEAADALPDIVRQAPVPLVADIHFDYRWALAAIRSGFDGLRLNPGNIRRRQSKARQGKGAASIRIGVNAGSCRRSGAGRRGMPPAIVEV